MQMLAMGDNTRGGYQTPQNLNCHMKGSPETLEKVRDENKSFLSFNDHVTIGDAADRLQAQLSSDDLELS